VVEEELLLVGVTVVSLQPTNINIGKTKAKMFAFFIGFSFNLYNFLTWKKLLKITP
jgi:hypothetical protein